MTTTNSRQLRCYPAWKTRDCHPERFPFTALSNRKLICDTKKMRSNISCKVVECCFLNILFDAGNIAPSVIRWIRNLWSRPSHCTTPSGSSAHASLVEKPPALALVSDQKRAFLSHLAVLSATCIPPYPKSSERVSCLLQTAALKQALSSYWYYLQATIVNVEASVYTPSLRPSWMF